MVESNNNVTETNPDVCVQPLMREVVENKAEITQQEARELVERCLKVLYYRDARSYNRVSSRTAD